MRWRAKGRPYGSWLLGRPGERAAVAVVRVQLLLTLAIVIANVVGAVVVFVLATLVLPSPEVDDSGEVIALNLVVTAIYTGVAVLVGVLWGTRRVRRRMRWAIEDREPDEREQRIVLRVPLLLLQVQAVLWALAVALFTTLNGLLDSSLIPVVALTVSFGGLVTCATAYLLTEFALRPLAARALASGPPERLFVPGVTVRFLLFWALGSAVPVLGLVLVATFAVIQEDVSSTRLSITIFVLGGTMLVIGALVSLLATRATADPIRSMRLALAQVEKGDLEVEVPVYDGTEVGLLQAGFNRMVAGLREREHIRDLFGRQVGEDVAQAALTGDVELGGEVRDVAVLFVDIVGSTELASKRPPQEVVALLNRFFAVVVDVVVEHGGLLNKFEGDAALAVFGAPLPLDDFAGKALAAARTLSERLASEVPELEAGIGVAAGQAVAGHIGEERRYEYTVIGDPVNEAARLQELAKSVPGRVVASADALECASEDEAGRWSLGDEVTVRGRDAPTRLATPD